PGGNCRRPGFQLRPGRASPRSSRARGTRSSAANLWSGATWPADFTAVVGRQRIWGQALASLPFSERDRIGGRGLTPSQDGTLILVGVGFSTTRRPGMRPSQPVAKVSGRLVWRRSIKRHQRRWNSRDPDDVGSLAMGVDGHDLDLVHATTDGFFKAMNSRMHSYGPTRVVCRERANCHAPVTVNQA